MDELFRLSGFGFTYPQQRRPALTGIDLTVHPGEFWVLCGPSGCGKSTLLRQLKTVLAPHGVTEGEVWFQGVPLRDVPLRQQAADIGFVLQSPEHQVVTDKVWHELAFGLESMGCDTPTIRRRVAEMASFFGIQGWFHKSVDQLSGGQKQLLSLASVMVMQPKVLILDEPTSQLDPIAAADFLQTLGRINRELGTTVLLTEHRLEDALPLATHAAVLDGGRLLCTGAPSEVGRQLRGRGHGMFLAMPAAMRIWASVRSDEPAPVTVREGRDFLRRWQAAHSLCPLPPAEEHPRGGPVLTAEGLWFRYAPEEPDVVRGLDLTVYQGELLALLGGNGAGKTTSLHLLSGALTPYRGTVRHTGRIGVLPQDPQALFVKKTVRQDLYEAFDGQTLPSDLREKRVAQAVSLCRLTELLDRHPYDLSGGEQQRAALCKVLLLDPEILLLDEPTKGLDAEFKQELAAILRSLTAGGVTVVMVSHDVEFCARCAHRCALFFDGSVVTEGAPRPFFSGNSFYTTSAGRMARELCAEAVTAEDVMSLIGGDVPPEPVPPLAYAPLPPVAEESAAWQPPRLPWWRKLTAAVSGLLALVIFWHAAKSTDLTALVGGGSVSAAGWSALWEYALFIAALFIAALFVTAAAIGRRSPPPVQVQTPVQKRRLSKRTKAAAALILVGIPAILFVGSYYFDVKNYYLMALLVLLACMLPFFMVFEGRKPQARELTVIAVLCALGVAGRAAFFMLPQFKPVLALTIIAGVAFGGETGFLVGAMTMLASNFLFSQGPWTPFQMFAAGIIGFLAGVLFRKGWLRRSRGALCLFGAIASIVIYGGLMNPVSALLYSQDLSWQVLVSYYLTGFPVDCVHAAATVFFLWVLAEPMLEKLDRIKTKYGLVE